MPWILETEGKLLVDRNHPLRKLFATLVARRVAGDAGARDAVISDYIAALLANFAHIDNLYRLRDSRGKRLEDVGEMLI